ncbi:MAG: SDR family oxidoreductase [Candidatus Hydrogenedentota bacterium]
MNNQTVLITGGARRLGKSISEHLGAKGYRVIIHHDQSGDEAQQLADLINEGGGDAHCVQAHLSDETSCKNLAVTVRKSFGDIHHLINNASIFPEDTLNTLNADSIQENFNINTLVPLFLARTLHESGTLATVTNLLDTRIQDYDRQHVSYHLSKRALQSLTAMMALEWAPEVRVNGIAPGLILPPEGQTEEHLEALRHTNPLNHIGNPLEVSETIDFLISNPSITGQIIYIDGGRHLKGRVYE